MLLSNFVISFSEFSIALSFSLLWFLFGIKLGILGLFSLINLLKFAGDLALFLIDLLTFTSEFFESLASNVASFSCKDLSSELIIFDFSVWSGEDIIFCDEPRYDPSRLLFQLYLTGVDLEMFSTESCSVSSPRSKIEWRRLSWLGDNSKLIFKNNETFNTWILPFAFCYFFIFDILQIIDKK